MPAVERGGSLPEGTIAAFLRSVSRAYGACGVTAVDGDKVIGKVRFYPKYLVDMMTTGCVQSDDGIRAIAGFDPSVLTPLESLSPKSLYVWCFQLVAEYSGQGIGARMLRTTIDWCRANGWDEIHCKATRHIRPLLDWSGMQSTERYKKFGFQIGRHEISDEMKQGVVAMRGGYHGEDVRKQWEPHAHLSDDEASWVYDVALRLR